MYRIIVDAGLSVGWGGDDGEKDRFPLTTGGNDGEGRMMKKDGWLPGLGEPRGMLFGHGMNGSW